MTRPDRILVVDDEPDLEVLVRQRYRKRIRANELDFLFAPHGERALELLYEQPDVEIVLTDINMPVMDGLTLLSRLREIDRLVKAVVVSAYGDMENIRSAMNLGAFDFLTKPIDLNDLDLTLDKTRREVALFKEAESHRKRLFTLEQDLAVASRIQQAMLPQRVPTVSAKASADLYGTMLPAKAVSGDFYDYFALDERRLAVVLGDVSGKGIPAALLMALSRILTKSVARTVADPAECLARVNRLVYEERGSDRFVTMFYGVVDLDALTLTYCNAGHNPPYIIRRGGTVEETPLTGGLVMGVNPDARYEQATLPLAPDDTLFLYSDGLTEAMTPDNRMYGEARLEALLRSVEGGAREIVDRVIEDVRAFTGDAEQSDDLTLAAARIVTTR